MTVHSNFWCHQKGQFFDSRKVFISIFRYSIFQASSKRDTRISQSFKSGKAFVSIIQYSIFQVSSSNGY